MANTYTLISSTVLNSSTGTVTISSIPQTYKDIVFRISSQTSYGSNNDGIRVKFMGDYGSSTWMYTLGSTSYAASRQDRPNSTGVYVGPQPGVTGNTFSNSELYIPNYTAALGFKPSLSFGVADVNSSSVTYEGIIVASASIAYCAGITSVDFTAANGSYSAGSSFYLYGIKNS
jgi:hypothetical protein